MCLVDNSSATEVLGGAWYGSKLNNKASLGKEVGGRVLCCLLGFFHRKGGKCDPGPY